MKRKLKKEIKDIMTYVVASILLGATWVTIDFNYKKVGSVETKAVTVAKEIEKPTEPTTHDIDEGVILDFYSDGNGGYTWEGKNDTTSTHPNALKICEYLPVLPEDGGGAKYFDPELQRYMKTLCEEQGLEYEFVLAICYVETKFDSSLNNAGLNSNGTTDWGLMQLNDAYIDAFCEQFNEGEPIDMLNAYENAKIGIAVLGDLSSRQSTMYDIACSYNMGEYGWYEYKNNVSASWHYGDKVLRYYGYIKDHFRNLHNMEIQG